MQFACLFAMYVNVDEIDMLMRFAMKNWSFSALDMYVYIYTCMFKSRIRLITTRKCFVLRVLHMWLPKVAAAMIQAVDPLSKLALYQSANNNHEE